ncbi:hypothetical protein HPP92_006454 [Vanilla planifolia]|uniref:Uncharacterized protein n=1 Tax=Vanilla planifolia TaxID=51239 RepID=A0A835RC37_VANPL|nr:hypothetical protein HPP92_006454 [Vanilla planifolia]
MTVTDMEEGDEEFDGGVVVGLKPTVMVPRHINKRSLRNKGLCISFDEKNLRGRKRGKQLYMVNLSQIWNKMTVLRLKKMNLHKLQQPRYMKPAILQLQ